VARINLLPWREQLREEKKREFIFFLTGCAILGAIVVFLAHMTMSHRISTQQSRNNILSQEIDHFEKKIKEIEELKKIKAALIARMMIIQELQASRPQVVNIFDEMVRILPRGVYLTEISRKDDKLTVQGISDSNSNISQLMKNIESSHWFNNPMLSVIKAEDVENKHISEFNLQSQVNHVVVQGKE
jgi:type IV pilus assembly protein PilN